MDDIKLVELSIKAAGWQFVEWVEDDNGINVARIIADERSIYFQPLHENTLTDCMGNALRLAVKLQMIIDFAQEDTGCLDHIIFTARAECHDKGDPYAATRRAIVRAAAAIGENK